MKQQQPNLPIAVLGAGSWGTALALVLARNGHPVRLWDADAAHLKQMVDERCNSRHLPGAVFPEAITIDSDLASVLAGVRDVLIVVPSHAFRDVVKQCVAWLSPTARIAWGTKGFDGEQGVLFDEVIGEELSADRGYAVIAGPSFAKEVAFGLPTAVVIAGNDPAFTQAMALRLHGTHFRAYLGDDVRGIEVCGAVKNILALAAGISDGLGYGANARCALITRGLAEMRRLGLAMGAKERTFMGLAGVGDLVLTCTDDQSRNRRFGLALGQGLSFQSAQEQIGQVIESIHNVASVQYLAQKLAIDMPISQQVYQILHQELSPTAAVQNLLSRDLVTE